MGTLLVLIASLGGFICGAFAAWKSYRAKKYGWMILNLFTMWYTVVSLLVGLFTLFVLADFKDDDKLY